MTFKRDVVTDLEKGTTTAGDWQQTAGSEFPAVTSPEITGYTPNQATVPAITAVTPDAKDSTVTVTYTLNSFDPRQSNSTQTTSSNALPKTGEDQRNLLLFLGLLLTSSAIFIVINRKKTKI